MYVCAYTCIRVCVYVCMYMYRAKIEQNPLTNDELSIATAIANDSDVEQDIACVRDIR